MLFPGQRWRHTHSLTACILREELVNEVAKACESQITRYSECVEANQHTYTEKCSGLRDALALCSARLYVSPGRDEGCIPALTLVPLTLLTHLQPHSTRTVEVVNRACRTTLVPYNQCIAAHPENPEEACADQITSFFSCADRVVRTIKQEEQSKGQSS